LAAIAGASLAANASACANIKPRQIHIGPRPFPWFRAQNFIARYLRPKIAHPPSKPIERLDAGVRERWLGSLWR